MFKKIFSSVLAAALVLGTAAYLPEGAVTQSGIVARAENFNDAKKVYVNQLFYDSLSENSEEHYYKFTTDKDGYIQVDFNKTYTDEGKGWSVTIYNQYQEKLIGYDVETGNSTPLEMLKIGVPSGTYYIEVTNYSYYYPTHADYSIRINYKSDNNWEKEFNNNIDNSDGISLNKKYYGGILNGDDDDYFKINITSSGKYRLYFGKDYSNEGKGWTITVYNSEMQSIVSKDIDKGNASTEKIDFKLDKGVNYILVSSYSYYYETDAIYNLKLVKLQSITGSKVSIPKSKYTYTGNKINPTPTVTLNGKTLKAGTDYSVSYSHNKGIGDAYIIITGKGGYTGSIDKPFTIIPKKSAVSKITSPASKRIRVTYKKAKGVTGYQVTYSTSSKFTKSATKTVSVKGVSSTSKTIKKLKKGKTYYVKVRSYKTVGGKKYYSAYSKVKSVKVK